MAEGKEQEVKIAKQKRGYLRASVTRDCKRVEDEFKSISDENQEMAFVVMKRLKQYQSDLRELNDTVQIHAPEDELATDIEKSLEYDENLMCAVDILESRMSAFVSRQVQPSPSQVGGTEFQSVTGARRTAKLEKLALTTFDGDPLKWTEFWDDFESTVDTRDDLATIDKFKYLKKALEGEALRVADGYMLTTANYDQVKADLKERYGDTEIAVFAHFEALLAVNAASHDHGQLCKVRDALETHIRSLEALGLAEDTFGQVFCPIILSKLPKFVKMELYRKNGSNKWTLSNLRSLLKEEMTARDKSERTMQTPSTGGKKGQGIKQGGSMGNKGSGSTMLSNGKQKQGGKAPKKFSCIFCEGPHAAYACTQYPTTASRLERARGLCSACLGKGHVTRQCKNRKPCYYCKRDNHHSSLCFEKFGAPAGFWNQGTQLGSQGGTNPQNSQAGSPPTLNPNAPVFPQVSGGAGGTGALPPFASGTGPPQQTTVVSPQPAGYAVSKTAVVRISAGQVVTSGQVFFDDGSTQSFITPKKARELGAKVIGEGYTDLGTFGVEKRRPVRWRAYEVLVHLPNGQTLPLILRESGTICPPIQLMALDPSKDPFLRQIPLAQPLLSRSLMVEVDILIGLDYYYQFIGPEEMRTQSGIVLLRSPLGYVTSGFVRGAQGTHSLHLSTVASQLLILPSAPSIDSVERFWDIEEMGIKERPGAKDDEVALQHFNDTISQAVDGRYEVHLPFKVTDPELADTYQLAYGRLHSQVNRFRQDSKIMGQVCQVFDDQLKAGIIEPAPDIPEGVEYYMPHHCVFDSERESTKIRVVFDASAKTSKDSLSLNDSIYRGPVFLQDLVGIIMRLRMHPIVLAADIAKAFHQVSLVPKHRDVTRFLWLKDITKPFSRSNLVVYRFARVPFGVNASPFLLAGTLIHHLKKEGGQTAETILSNLYVDNVFAGFSATSDALHFFQESKALFASAYMNLRQFYSNDPNFSSSIPEKDRGTLAKPKILGVQWDNSTDTLSARVGNGCPTETKTKRAVLSALASVYDPCGWLSPVTVRAKILMQEIWKRGNDWDKRLPEDLLKMWDQIQDDLSQIGSVSIPRFHSCPNPVSFEIHAFSDASTKAYAGVVYLLVKSPSKSSCLLLFAKARVAPLKDMTIPRLELLGAWITARMLKFVEDQLRITVSKKVLWTDSMCVVGWLTNTSKVATTAYVRRRVDEILEVKNLEIHYVPSESNPADMASRGVSLPDLKEESLWWDGPPWLADESSWPQVGSHHPQISEPTEKAQSLPIFTPPPTSSLVIDISRFSSLKKLLRVTSLVFRFVRGKRNQSKGSVSASEMQHAIQFWESYIQSKYLTDLLASAKTRDLVPYPNLDVLLADDGLLRCKGRFQNASLSSETKHPILLPPRNHFSFLVIMDVHERLMHTGVNHTLASLRSKYWVPHGRAEVKSVLKECKLCRKLRGGPYKVPNPPPLPEFRVNPQRTFACVGLDYLGPLFVSTRTEDQKIWVALFTCATTRALYLDIVDSLTTSDFLLCLRRFVALYGLPNLICSDNARQFHTADAVIKKAWKSLLESEEICNFSSTNGITWKFTTDLAPWMGGFYERLVAPVKQSLRSVLGRRKVSAEELQTLVFEIASILNSRPLFHSGSDVDDSPLTPADLLYKSAQQFPSFQGNTEFIPGPTSKVTDVLAQWVAGQKLLDSFWNQWQNQYLLNLRQQSAKFHQRNCQDTEPKVGTVVLIKDNLPRAQWKYGKIKQLRVGSDGKIRTVAVLVPSGKTLLRPLRLLYPLEISTDSAGDSGSDSSGEVPDSRTPNNRLPRSAALRARAKIREQFSEEQSLGC